MLVYLVLFVNVCIYIYIYISLNWGFSFWWRENLRDLSLTKLGFLFLVETISERKREIEKEAFLSFTHTHWSFGSENELLNGIKANLKALTYLFLPLFTYGFTGLPCFGPVRNRNDSCKFNSPPSTLLLSYNSPRAFATSKRFVFLSICLFVEKNRNYELN